MKTLKEKANKHAADEQVRTYTRTAKRGKKIGNKSENNWSDELSVRITYILIFTALFKY